METFTDNMLKALESDEVGDRLKLLFRSVVEDIMELTQSVKDIVVSTLRAQLTARDDKIASLESEMTRLNDTLDDLEQHSRRGSIRVFEIPEEGDGNTDDKLLALFNQRMKMQPPISLDDIEVSHRLGKVAVATATTPDNADDGTGAFTERPSPKPRAIIVKFASRRTEACVMKARKNLRPSCPSRNDDNDAPDPPSHSSDVGDDDATDSRPLTPVYITDDLTKGRAKIAYLARELKRKVKIRDTWVLDSKIYVRDLHNRVKNISSLADLNRYQ